MGEDDLIDALGKVVGDLKEFAVPALPTEFTHHARSSILHLQRAPLGLTNVEQRDGAKHYWFIKARAHGR
jgi:hypothetical protein